MGVESKNICLPLDCLQGGVERKTYPEPVQDLIRTSIYDTCSGSMKITINLDHISHRKLASGTNLSSIWTYREFIISTRRD